jgi:hypothetical protein
MSSNVCNDQNSFNNALDKYQKEKTEEIVKKYGVAYVIFFILYFIAIIYAVILALKVSDVEHRRLHVVFALIAAPAYIIAYYLS